MITGLLSLELFLPNALSLKAKRSALRPFLETVRRKWNVSASETGRHDSWQRAQVGIAAVSGEEASVRRILDEVLRHASDQYEIEVLESGVEIL